MTIAPAMIHWNNNVHHKWLAIRYSGYLFWDQYFFLKLLCFFLWEGSDVAWWFVFTYLAQDWFYSQDWENCSKNFQEYFKLLFNTRIWNGCSLSKRVDLIISPITHVFPDAACSRLKWYLHCRSYGFHCLLSYSPADCLKYYVCFFKGSFQFRPTNIITNKLLFKIRLM